jgi:hypothetical protein
MAHGDRDERFTIDGDPEDALRDLLRSDTALSDEDRALIRASRLALEDFTDEIFAEIETLLPTLVAAGYAEALEDRWGFTPKGIERAEELDPDA